jgi:hypothetical protein
MDKAEARKLMSDKLAELRNMRYEELHAWAESRRVGVEDVVGRSGRKYHLEIQSMWDGRKGEDVRVIVAVDDGGWRSFMPLSDDFIMAPDGSFVDE